VPRTASASFLSCFREPLLRPEVQAVCLTDDVTFLGPPDGAAVARAVRAYDRGALRYNLRFQGAKSFVVAFHGQPLSPEVRQLAAEKQMSIETDFCIIGGTPMGPNRRRVQEAALRIAHKSQRFFQALQHEAMTTTVADRLLRLCGVPRIQYLARVGYPGEYDEALQYFDRKVRHAARAQAGFAESCDAATQQQAAPLRHGGFAFRAYADNISFLCFPWSVRPGCTPHTQSLSGRLASGVLTSLPTGPGLSARKN